MPSGFASCSTWGHPKTALAHRETEQDQWTLCKTQSSSGEKATADETGTLHFVPPALSRRGAPGSSQKHPQLGKYVRDWGREGDLGFVAIANAIDTNHKIGAAWLRLFPSTDPGYGYLDDRIPELAIAVLPQYRGQGVGTQLLDRLLAAAKPKYPAISLSVRSDNPAVKLYRRFGFEVIEESETVNRVGGRSFNMKIDLV